KTTPAPGVDGNIWRSKNRLPVDGSVRAEIQSQGPGIEAVDVIVKNLIKVVDPKQDLIGHPRCQNRIERDGVVVYVNRGFLEIERKIRTGCAQRRTCTQRGGLASLSAEPTGREVVLFSEVMVELDDAVVTVAGGCHRTKEVLELSREIRD